MILCQGYGRFASGITLVERPHLGRSCEFRGGGVRRRVPAPQPLVRGPGRSGSATRSRKAPAREHRRDHAHQPLAVLLQRPAAGGHEKVWEQGVDQRPTGVGSTFDADILRRPPVPARWGTNAVAPVRLSLRILSLRDAHRYRRGPRRGRRPRSVSPRAHLQQDVDPHPNQPARVPLGEYRLHCRTLGAGKSRN